MMTMRVPLRRACPNRYVYGLVVLLTSALGAYGGDPVRQQSALDFNRDIRPVLSDQCFACHGPDESKRKAKLRLDFRTEALKKGVIVPGKPDESELVRRVFSTE